MIKNDLDAFTTFYHSLYEAQFPDYNERESIENMLQYLRLKVDGWYGLNNYHIVLGYDEDVLVSACVSDYFHTGNTGVIEFLLVSPQTRGKGYGRQMLNEMHRIFDADARRASHSGVDYIMGEMNDPFLTDSTEDNIDPFGRAKIWGGWGFGVLDFPYVQPALADDKTAVRNLLLMAKSVGKVAQENVSSATVKSVTFDYLKWAMRFDDPTKEIEYRKMSEYLDAKKWINLMNLQDYVGDSNSNPLVKFEINSADQLDAVLPIYHANFGKKPNLAIDTTEFRKLIEARPTNNFKYHLWGLAANETNNVEGMASFFSFPWGGFGGYIVLDGTLRGTGRLRPLIAMMERQMLTDYPKATGWYIECDPGKIENIIFDKVGFHRISIDYRQPILTDGKQTIDPYLCPSLELRYKPFGRVYESGSITATEVLTAVRDIFRVVYGIADPSETAAFKHLTTEIRQRGVERLMLM